MNSPPKQFETKRLQLRKPLLTDAVTIFEQYAQDEEVTKYLIWQPHKNIKETKEFLRRCINVWKEGMAFPWAIIRKSDQQFLGMIEIVGIDQHGVNIGYVLAKKYWGKGYMPEALKVIIDWAFQQEEVFRVWAFCDTANLASVTVLEKVGMQREGVLRRWIKLSNLGEEPRDCFSYSIVR
jgi:[ribosomal protein S5]-alanine N-acetyltransferase